MKILPAANRECDPVYRTLYIGNWAEVPDFAQKSEEYSI